MPDEIIGISVLQPTWYPLVYRLWFDGRKASGETAQSCIFIKELPGIGVPDRMPDYGGTNDHIWKFTKRGQFLDCNPSVNWISWGFHNGGTWSTQYVEMTKACPREEIGHDEDASRWYVGHTVHYDLNRVETDPARRQALIVEMVATGFLKPLCVSISSPSIVVPKMDTPPNEAPYKVPFMTYPPPLCKMGRPGVGLPPSSS